jgi:cytochrome c peroxidase
MNGKPGARPNLLRQAAVGMIWALFAVLGWWFYQPEHKAPPQRETSEEPTSSLAPLQPLPLLASLHLDPARVALGEKLFSDPRFSSDNSVSCNSCHNLANAGVDNLPRSVGAHGQLGIINTPTVFNSAFNFTQFWDGRAENLEQQIDSPITSKTEFASSWPEVLGKLGGDRSLRAEFERVFTDGLNAANTRAALAEFERSLLAPSRFDRYLRGETGALTAAEQHGYQLFLDYGCAACHQGRNIGGNLFQKMGVAHDYFANRPSSKADNGRYNLTHDPRDLHVFKVPSLRNVERTAPYFHDARAQTLDEAISEMAYYQLGVTLPDNDRAALATFLKSLTGEYQGKAL